MWLRDGGYSLTVNAVWGSSSQNATMFQIVGKIKACGEKVLVWSHQSFGSIKKQLEILGKRLTKAKIEAAKGKLDYEVVKGLKAKVSELYQDHSNLIELFAMTVSLIWAHRNQLRVGEKVLQLKMVNAMAGDNLLEFQNAMASPHPALPRGQLYPPVGSLHQRTG